MTTNYSKLTTSDDYSPVIFDEKYADEAPKIRVTRLKVAALEQIKRGREKLLTITDEGQIAFNKELYKYAEHLCHVMVERYYSSSYGSQVLARILLALDNPGDAENAKQMAILAKNVPGTSAKDLHLAAVMSYVAAALAVVVICITIIPSGGMSLAGLYGVLAWVVVGQQLDRSAYLKTMFQRDLTVCVAKLGFFSPKEGVPMSPVVERKLTDEVFHDNVVSNLQL